MDLGKFLASVNWRESSPLGREYKEFNSTGLVNHDFIKGDQHYKIVLGTAEVHLTKDSSVKTHQFRVWDVSDGSERYVMYRAFSLSNVSQALAIHSVACQYFEGEGFEQVVSQEAA